MEQQLYTAVSSTSSWLDGVENNVFSGSVLLAENAETQLQKQEVHSGVFVQLLSFMQKVFIANHISLLISMNVP